MGNRVPFWDSLGKLVVSSGRGWALVGDLNLVLAGSDKDGGRSVTWGSRNILRNFLGVSGGIDLGASGGKFTWSNGRGPKKRIKARLDRVIVSGDWLCRFGKAGVINLPIVGSDHAPIILDCFMLEAKGRIPFQFYDAWANEPFCRETVEAVWKKDVMGYDSWKLADKARRVGMELRGWQARRWAELRLGSRIVRSD